MISLAEKLECLVGPHDRSTRHTVSAALGAICKKGEGHFPGYLSSIGDDFVRAKILDVHPTKKDFYIPASRKVAALLADCKIGDDGLFILPAHA